jgi:restriction modification system DNA specificity subunit
MVGELKMKSEFKNLPSGWKVVRLGDVCEINPSSRKLPEKFYYIDLESVEKGILHSLKEVFLETAPSRAQRLLEKGDILFQMVRPYQKNNFLFELNGDFVASTGYAQIRTKQNRDFIFQYLNFDTFTKKVIEKCTGSNYPAINASVFSNLMILLPTLDEQEKIAEILSTWDEAINLTINLIESKKQFKKALMQNLLTAKINWHTTTLGSTGEIITGSTPSTTNEKFWNGEIAWITPTDIGDKKDIFIGERSITQDGLKTIRELPANSLLVTCIASIGKNAILKVKGSCNQQINALIPNKNFNVDFLYYLLEFEKERLKNLAGITATLIISKALFSKFKISFPNIIEQQKIAEVLTACDDEINLLNLKLENLKKQKQGLMQKLLSGKVRTRI